MTWTIEAWCAAQRPTDLGALDGSAQAFLERLALPAGHPFCRGDGPAAYAAAGAPPQGPLQGRDHLETSSDVLWTVFYRVCPPLLAMAELWVRLFAFVLAPLGLAWLVWAAMAEPAATPPAKPRKLRRGTVLVAILTLASSLVLATDDLYRLEFGTRFGLNMLLCAAVLVVRVALTHGHRLLITATVLTLALAMILLFDSTHGRLTMVNHALPQFEEGLYYDESNLFARRVHEHWPASVRSYAPPKATAWMPTGDSRTGLPFLLNSVPSPSWTRVWVPIPEDGEVVALDIHFPHGRHSAEQPLYLLLHGLNGGSQEEYVKDFALRRGHLENATVAVMVARGLMDLPVRGMNLFHGARWTDVRAAAAALRRGRAPGQLLAGVGYSMGGIILANYVARSGPATALDTAVSISGGLDMRHETNFSRAQRLWQPILTQELREKFVVGKWGERTKMRLTKEQMKQMMRAYHITEIDETAVVIYNGFRDLDHYYSEMSALGDIPLTSDGLLVDASSTSRINNISIPILVIHAFDDPLITWQTVAANGGLMHPRNLTTTGNGNLFLLLTKRGGHVGWPVGYLPHRENWRWMNDNAKHFVHAVQQARKELGDHQVA